MNTDAAKAILYSAIDFKCGFDPSFDKMSLSCPAHADYWIPYYVVELVPGSFESVFLPDVGQVLNETLGSIQSTVMETLLNGINAGNKGKRVTFSKRAGGSFGNVHYYEAHVYRLDFDPLEAFKKALEAKLKGNSFSLASNLVHPDICYMSEIDPFRWRLRVPMREKRAKRLPSTCEQCTGVDPVEVCIDVSCKKSWLPGFKEHKHYETIEHAGRPEDRHRFWEGIRRPVDGFFSWAGINDRSGWVTQADPKFAAAALSLRAASLGSWSQGNPGGCWTDGRGADEFDPLDPDVLANDEVRVQLVYDSDGYGWDKCIAPGWEAKEWKRDEYWKGRVNNGAIFVVYKKANGCMLDADLAKSLIYKATESAVLGALSGGIGTFVDIAKQVEEIKDAVDQIKDSWQDFVKALEEIPKKVEQAKDAMEMILDNIGGGFTALGALLLTGDADVAAGVATMQLNAAQTGFNMQLEANLQVAELTGRLVSLRIDSVKATGERKRELEEQAKDLESLKSQVVDRAKQLAKDLIEQQAKQVAGQGIQLGIGGLFTLVGVPAQVAYSVECAADSAWETYEGVMKLATFEACGIGIGDASRKAGNAIAKMEEFRRKGQKVAKHAKPLMEPACPLAHQGVQEVHKRVCAPVGPYCDPQCSMTAGSCAGMSFHVKADKFLGYGKYADMACQVIDMVMSPPKDASGWLMGVMGTVVPNLGDLGSGMDALSALSDLPDPTPLLSAVNRIQNAVVLTSHERQKAVQDIQALVSALKGPPSPPPPRPARSWKGWPRGNF